MYLSESRVNKWNWELSDLVVSLCVDTEWRCRHDCRKPDVLFRWKRNTRWWLFGKRNPKCQVKTKLELNAMTPRVTCFQPSVPWCAVRLWDGGDRVMWKVSCFLSHHQPIISPRMVPLSADRFVFLSVTFILHWPDWCEGSHCEPAASGVCLAPVTYPVQSRQLWLSLHKHRNWNAACLTDQHVNEIHDDLSKCSFLGGWLP